MADESPRNRKLYDRFDLLFYITVSTVALLLLVDLRQGGFWADLLSVIVTALTAATLLLAVVVAGIRDRWRRLAIIAAGFTVGASVVAAFSPYSSDVYSGLLWLLLVGAAPVLALRRLMHRESVTAEALLGALSIYLLIAVAATYLFLFIDTFLGGSGRFFGTSEPTTVFMYFSLVTITTLGYGDFNPAAEFARAAAVWEAVIGQVFLVVVVARLISLIGSRRIFGKSTDPDAAD
jgi:hypothetical protein